MILVASYNNTGLDDTLVLTLQNETRRLELEVESFGDFVIVRNPEGEVVAVNVFNASNYLEYDKEGAVQLSEDDIAKLNDALGSNGSDVTLPNDTTPKIVIGYVEESEPMEDSDHLNITQTRVGDDEVYQIVCGAPNVEAGQKVVVALPGAQMPNGQIIWAGELRGTPSHGMICSARELGLSKDSYGILELDDDAEVGKAFFN